MDECKPLPTTSTASRRFSSTAAAALPPPTVCAVQQRLTLAHFRAQIENLRDTLLTLELNLITFGPHPQVNLLNLSTFGPHPRVNLGYMVDTVSSS